jgi:hypothetical protein
MNVDLMEGPPRIIERTVEVAGQVRRRRRRRRALAGALLITATVGALASVAAATRDDHGGLTVAAGSSTTTASGPAVWDAKVTRARALEIGRERANDPATAIVTAKLASWAEIQAADRAVGRSSEADPGRRVWAVSISGEFSGRGGQGPSDPYRWAVVFVDASNGSHPPIAIEAGSTGDIAPWFAVLPDHGA